ncbi:MAG: FAD-dependent oxidoreductase [Deltaproteobacteria bacterium]|nr:MAG: FAD-dependent oxidoreductase [Deltaproteobacteria bacterium]
MKSYANIVIIGGGVIGTSIAYHLSKMGMRDIILVDKGELTSGATFHSAGLVGQLRSSVTLTKIMMYSIDLYSKLEEETEQYTGWRQVGGLRIASSKERMEELKKASSMAKTFGLPLELISAKEAKKLFPIMNDNGIFGAAFLPTDGHLDPSGITYALAKGARNRGVDIYVNTRVTDIKIKKGLYEIITDKGSIKAEIVVNAAGMWAPEIGKMVGVDIPIIPMAHQYVITKPIEGVLRTFPTMRDPDNLVYFREEVGGLVMGGYEKDPAPWALDGIPKDFSHRLLQPDWDRFEPLINNAIFRVPVIGEAEVIKLVNGPEAFTPDGEFILGEASNLRNFYVAAGFCAHGIAAGGGIGKVMAEWIIEGEPSLDLRKMDIHRFGSHHASKKYTLDRTWEVYHRYYDIHYPFEEMEKGRPLRTSPVYHRLKELRAVFGEKLGWERANWFAPADVEPKEKYGWGKPNWFEIVKEEHKAVRERAGLFDLSSFSKIEIKGYDALKILELLCDNKIDQPVGKVIYTQMLNKKGGIVSDITVSHVAENHFYIVAGTAFGRYDIDWIKKHTPEDSNIKIDDVTSAYGTIGLWGPNAPKIIESITGEDFSLNSFPYMSLKKITIGYAPVLALRVSYVGETGWEFHIPAEYTLYLWDLLLDAGKDFGLRPVGYRTIDSLRLEKGYRVLGSDITSEYTPLEAGLDFCVRLDKSDFIGKEAIVSQKKKGIKQKLCLMVLKDDSYLPIGKEAIYYNDKVIGRVTSAGYGYTVEKMIAYGYLPLKYAEPNTKVVIDISNNLVEAEVSKAPLYDPKNRRLR